MERAEKNGHSFCSGHQIERRRELWLQSRKERMGWKVRFDTFENLAEILFKINEERTIRNSVIVQVLKRGKNEKHVFRTSKNKIQISWLSKWQNGSYSVAHFPEWLLRKRRRNDTKIFLKYSRNLPGWGELEWRIRSKRKGSVSWRNPSLPRKDSLPNCFGRSHLRHHWRLENIPCFLGMQNHFNIYCLVSGIRNGTAKKVCSLKEGEMVAQLLHKSPAVIQSYPSPPTRLPLSLSLFLFFFSRFIPQNSIGLALRLGDFVWNISWGLKSLLPSYFFCHFLACVFSPVQRSRMFVSWTIFQLLVQRRSREKNVVALCDYIPSFVFLNWRWGCEGEKNGRSGVSGWPSDDVMVRRGIKKEGSQVGWRWHGKQSTY